EDRDGVVPAAQDYWGWCKIPSVWARARRTGKARTQRIRRRKPHGCALFSGAAGGTPLPLPRKKASPLRTVCGPGGLRRPRLAVRRCSVGFLMPD
ncbi:MAG: hypothetical protein IKK25_00640, partial [Lentisphaeria bacterium]|nr:hypothetical protein [Lentisphaeria bacterium]